MSAELPFTRIVESLPPTVPFVPPEALERERGRLLQLRVGANESNFGLSPRAREAMARAVDQVHWYNDPEGYELRAALAIYHGVEIAEVGLGAGIDEILGLMVRLFAEPGDAVVTSLGAYPTFNYHVEGYGAVLHKAPYRDDREDLPGLLAKAQEERPKLVYVANPDNPMGTWQRVDELRDFIDALPAGCVLLLDEAYVDFAPEEVLLPLEMERAQVVRLRTFSKAHGMAGARIGYVLAHREVVGALDKVRNHFGVNRVAQAGALASLADGDFVRAVVRQVAQGQEEYAALAVELGLGVVPSATNFVALDIGSGDRARSLMQALLARDVFVRMPGVAPLDRCIRLTVGPAAERAAFAEVLRNVLPQIGECR
jgi:histidinol-phosphate aminotransferase